MKRTLIIAILGVLWANLGHSGQIGTGNVSTGSVTCYPNVYETRHVETSGDVMRTQVPNDQNASILNMQWTMGILPQGGFSTIADRLNATYLSTPTVIYLTMLATSYIVLNADLQGFKIYVSTTYATKYDMSIATTAESNNRINQDILIGQATGYEQLARILQDLEIGISTGQIREDLQSEITNRNIAIRLSTEPIAILVMDSTNPIKELVRISTTPITILIQDSTSPVVSLIDDKVRISTEPMISLTQGATTPITPLIRLSTEPIPAFIASTNPWTTDGTNIWANKSGNISLGSYFNPYAAKLNIEGLSSTTTGIFIGAGHSPRSNQIVFGGFGSGGPSTCLHAIKTRHSSSSSVNYIDFYLTNVTGEFVDPHNFYGDL